ncbi:hypothetical protein ElyMa_005596300 [Elysia marginata]|uniref:Uncharacterized protein n=1 Tax=Elysia marginata TaxID=1093978 RepID=A0AAV4F6F2_9GAST|nr:hypothetical protein ElyMa_005596300 [Elysia marginata]
MVTEECDIGDFEMVTEEGDIGGLEIVTEEGDIGGLEMATEEATARGVGPNICHVTEGRLKHNLSYISCIVLPKDDRCCPACPARKIMLSSMQHHPL